jgi:putative tricarboxylic transport membrane protein
MIAISAPARVGGDVASVPTWKELGVNAVSANWRAVVGPKSMTPPQIAYWDQALGAMVKTAEWREAARKNQWSDDYLNAAGTLKFFQEEYKHLDALLTELGDAKKTP